MSSDRKFHPVSTEARGRVRRWKAEQTAYWLDIDRVFRSDAVVGLANEFAFRGSLKGRVRAFDAIRKLIPRYAYLEGVRYNPKQKSCAVWAAFQPSGPLTPMPQRVGETQPCTVLMFCAMYRDGNISQVRHGFWSLEIFDHALGRLVQRGPEADITETLLEAHHNLLAGARDAIATGLPDLLKSDVVFGDPEDKGFLVPAGPGHFICTAWIGLRLIEVEDGDAKDGSSEIFDEHSMHVRAHTWIHRDQDYHERHEYRTLVPGRPGGRLGDSFLVPIRPDGSKLTEVVDWSPGLPETRPSR